MNNNWIPASEQMPSLLQACKAALKYINGIPTDRTDYRDSDEVVTLLEFAIGEASSNGWIPVGERLPEINDYGNSESVLVVFAGSVYEGKTYNDIPRVTTGQLNQNRWVTSVGGYAGYPIITHWQPLPQPPTK